MKNNYRFENDRVIISIKRKNGQEYEAIIDKEDFEKINSYKGKWTLIQSRTNNDLMYAVTNVAENGKFTMKLMHRIILNISNNMFVDHRNHNTLDNTKNNLNVVTPSENQQNRKGATKHSKSGVRGVYWSGRYKKWIGQIRVNKKKVWERKFNNIEDAKSEIEKARLIYHPYAINQ